MSLFLVLGPVHLHQARAAGVEEQRLLELINGYRQENGVGPLVSSGVLSTSAQRHSEDMAAHDFFSHSTRESSYYPGGSSPADRAAREGYPTNVYTAENIALGQQTAEEVFEDWRGSPEHNAAMLGEQYTAAGIGHVDSYWTADFGSVADTPSGLEIFEPYAGRIVESATGKQTLTPPSAAEQTTGEREGDEQSTGDERTPQEQAQLEGTQPEAQQDVTVENEPAAGETATTGQTSIPQQATAVQAPDGAAPTTEDTPDPGPDEETTLGTVTSPRPLTEGTGAEQYALETALAEILSPSGEELEIEDLDVGTTAQEAVTEEGFHRVSPVETEAMETALATREDIPEDLVWQAPSVPEQPTGGPAADQSPAAFGLGASGGGGVAGITPLATKELPETSDASPLTLFLGGFLLLCGFLVFGAARRQRGS
ncbi:MAG: LPXTG cell wall anchor domain-containing protein [Rubrobacter sp.]|nr:LPXTG cell wall anchor domain-containing protein [Rubrobacter sp.]